MMKKTIFLFIMLSLCLIFTTSALSDFYYVIMLKNGGAIATPHYWVEGNHVYFFYAGGTVGVEKQVVERVEKHSGTRNFIESTPDIKETRGLLPSPTATGNPPRPDKLPAEIEGKPKGDVKKDPSLVLEFNNLEKKFRSSNNMSADELKELRYDLAELQAKIASSPSERKFREEANKINGMRRVTNDLLIIKSRSQ